MFLSNIEFSCNDILKIIQILDSQKAHGHNRTITWLSKVCGISIYKLLEVIFELYLESGFFPLE